MNTELLLKVKAHVLEEPRRIWMSVVLANAKEPVSTEYETKLGVAKLIKNKPPCGTVGCIAGWTQSLSGYDYFSKSTRIARELLDIDWDQSCELFYVNHWPEPYRSRYPKCRTAKQRARCVADRIDHFIATKGTDQRIKTRGRE